MSNITCLRCKEPIDSELDACPHCGERVTLFQRTYAARLIDGKYQILDRLGIGGMGEIFKVRHIHLNELRVIKIMRPNVASDDQGLQRFLQEARTSTMIKHKNLAMLYDFSQLDDGSYYMVWEFIDGTNIQKWIAQNGTVPARLAVEISIQALTGLEHLHSMGLIHRDISPENIMLSQDHHGKLLVKVIDFGIAKQLAEGESGQGLTQTGMFLGKLKYASPEQAGFLKEGEHIDPRSDLYSFGIVMYEMLAGRAPFQATNPHGYILKHVTEKPLPIMEANPAVSVPPKLEAIIQKSLEKNREARFATAAAFAGALEQIRAEIQPDQKYGLGERMVTLSGAQTLIDAPKLTRSDTTGATPGTQQTFGAGGTKPAPRVGPTGTRSAADEATVMERDLSGPQTLSGAAPTTLERKSSGDEATVMERVGASAASTVLEPKAGWEAGGAVPTVLERKVGQAPASQAKGRTGLFAGIAAAILLLAAGVIYWATRRTQPVTTTVAQSGTSVTATAAGGPPIPAGRGVLLLSASPWGDLDKIVSAKDNTTVSVAEDNRSTPARIELEPGNYHVTLSGPSGTRTFDVSIDAGKSVPKNIDMSKVNLDDLAKEVSQQ